ncbi:MAG TPA: class II glutamine amidotransferase [Thermoleophilaceae bacterium]|nr:class II glutamine amidotransferase [Thermoleophilaceae bacterium]
MCRWNAYIGEPLVIGELLYRTKHGLIDESLHSRMGAETTNGDGFGVGWYGAADRTTPARYRSVSPAWNDLNMREIADHVESPLFLAHIRAAVGSPVQQTNCHPFRYQRWLFVHNGLVKDMRSLRRELLLEVEPSLFPGIAGSTDSELLFHLALGFGLEDDPVGAMERAVGLVEDRARRQGIDDPVQMTIGISDGERLWAIRYSSQHESRTLFVSEDVEALQRLHPENERLQRLHEGDFVVVSEPLVDLPGAWHEVAESRALEVADGLVEQRPFAPAG